jgi:hypothetical protein
MKRKNPSKCNDGSYSKTANKQGACTWHQGVEKEVTTKEYKESQLRVRYGSPKGYKGAFAPRKGKSVSKPKATTKPKQQKPVGKTVVVEFEIPANFTGVIHHTVSSIISVFIVEKGNVLVELEFEEQNYYIKFLMAMLVGLSVKKEKKPTGGSLKDLKQIFDFTSMADAEATFNTTFKKRKLFKVGQEYMVKLARELNKSPVIFHDVNVLRYDYEIPKHWKKGRLWLDKCKVISMVLTDSQWEYVLLNLSHSKHHHEQKDVLFYVPKSEGNAYDDKHPITSIFRNHDFMASRGWYGLDQLKLSKKVSKTLLEQVQPLLLNRYKGLHASLNDVVKMLMPQGEWVKKDPTSHEHAVVAQYSWYYDGKQIGTSAFRLKKRNHDDHLYSDGDGSRGYKSFSSLAKVKEWVFETGIYPVLLSQGLIEGVKSQSKPKKSKAKAKPKAQKAKAKSKAKPKAQKGLKSSRLKNYLNHLILESRQLRENINFDFGCKVYPEERFGLKHDQSYFIVVFDDVEYTFTIKSPHVEHMIDVELNAYYNKGQYDYTVGHPLSGTVGESFKEGDPMFDKYADEIARFHVLRENYLIAKEDFVKNIVGVQNLFMYLKQQATRTRSINDGVYSDDLFADGYLLNPNDRFGIAEQTISDIVDVISTKYQDLKQVSLSTMLMMKSILVCRKSYSPMIAFLISDRTGKQIDALYAFSKVDAGLDRLLEYHGKTVKGMSTTELEKLKTSQKAELHVDRNSLNEQYKALNASDNKALQDATVDALYSFDLIKKSDIPILKDEYKWIDVKNLVSIDAITYFEQNADSEQELIESVNALFDKIADFLERAEQQKEDQSKVPTVVWSKKSTSEDLIPQLIVLDEWGQRNDIAKIRGNLRSDYVLAFKNPVQTLLKEWLAENYTRFTKTKKIDLNRVFNIFLSEVIVPFAPNTSSSGLKSQVYNNKDTWFIPKIKSTIKSLQKKELAKGKRTVTDLETLVSKALKKVKARKNKIYKAVQKTEQFKKIGGIAKFGSAPAEESLENEGTRLLKILENQKSPYSKDQKMTMVDRYIQQVKALLAKPISDPR